MKPKKNEKTTLKNKREKTEDLTKMQKKRICQDEKFEYLSRRIVEQFLRIR